MKTSIRTSKTKTYINFNGEFFVTNNDWANKEILPVDFNAINDQQKEALSSVHGWQEIGEHSDLQTAYYAFIGLETIRKNERKTANAKLSEKWAKEQAEKWLAIKDLNVIPATPENIRTLLVELNKQNWGSWQLPKLSIGYKCAQYDCDGQTATTITLDRPIKADEFCKPFAKYQVGAPFGHLNNYNRI